MADPIHRRAVTVFWLDGNPVYRAHVWTERGYSSKTFTATTEAAFWTPEWKS